MTAKSGPFVIAEAGVNHNGSTELAAQLVEAAAAAGADAVKFQTFRADDLVTRSAAKAAYQERTTGKAQSQYEMLKALELPVKAYSELVRLAHSKGLEFMSTAFDLESLKFLINEVGIKRIKIPSGDALTAPIVVEAARSGLPVILSTGACDLEEIRLSLGMIAAGIEDLKAPKLADFEKLSRDPAILRKLASRVTVLHCVTAYPAPLEEMNLRAIATISKEFGVPVGLSDHSTGTLCGPLAVALGAGMLEKHYTMDRSLPGPDHKASLVPAELSEYVRLSRDAARAMGDGQKRPTPSELQNRPVARRSLVAIRPIRAGEVLSAANIACKRPGTGVSSRAYFDVLGRTSSRDYAEDQLINEAELD